MGGPEVLNGLIEQELKLALPDQLAKVLHAETLNLLRLGIGRSRQLKSKDTPSIDQHGVKVCDLFWAVDEYVTH